MENKDFKCGNCGTIVKDKILSWSTGDVRNACETCGPLCEDCVDGDGGGVNKNSQGDPSLLGNVLGPNFGAVLEFQLIVDVPTCC